METGGHARVKPTELGLYIRRMFTRNESALSNAVLYVTNATLLYIIRLRAWLGKFGLRVGSPSVCPFALHFEVKTFNV